jgi:hypothetical protein
VSWSLKIGSIAENEIRATDLRNRLHDQHSNLSSHENGSQCGPSVPGSRLDADHPENGVLIPCRNTCRDSVLHGLRRGSCFVCVSLGVARVDIDRRTFSTLSPRKPTFTARVGMSQNGEHLRLRALKLRREYLVVTSRMTSLVSFLHLKDCKTPESCR